MASSDLSPRTDPDPTQAGPQPGPAWAVPALFCLGLLLGGMAGAMPEGERTWRYFFVALGGAAGSWYASRRRRDWVLFPLAALVLISVQESHRLALTWVDDLFDPDFLDTASQTVLPIPPDLGAVAFLLAGIAVMISCAVRHLENLRELFGGRALDTHLVIRGEIRFGHFVLTFVHPSLVIAVIGIGLLSCACTALPMWLGADRAVLWTDVGLAAFLSVAVGWTLVWGLPAAVRERGAGVMLEEIFVVGGAGVLLLIASGKLAWAELATAPLALLFLVQGITRLSGAGFLIHGALGLAAGLFPLFQYAAAERGVPAWAPFGGLVAVLAAGELWSFGIIEQMARSLYLTHRFARAFPVYLTLATAARDPHARQRCGVLAALSARRAGLLLEAAGTYEAWEQWADAGELYLELARDST